MATRLFHASFGDPSYGECSFACLIEAASLKEARRLAFEHVEAHWRAGGKPWEIDVKPLPVLAGRSRILLAALSGHDDAPAGNGWFEPGRG